MNTSSTPTHIMPMREFIIQDGVVYDFPKSRGDRPKVIGGFIEDKFNVTARPPTRDEVAAFERSKLPVEKWHDFDHGRLSPTWMTCSCGGNYGDHTTLCGKHDFDRRQEAAMREYGLTKTEPTHPSKAPTPETMRPFRDALRKAMMKIGPAPDLPMPSDDDCAAMWHACHRDCAGYDKAAEECRLCRFERRTYWMVPS